MELRNNAIGFVFQSFNLMDELNVAENVALALLRANGEEVMPLLTELNAEGTTVDMVTHSHSHSEYAHRIVNLLDGASIIENARQVLGG